MAERELKFLLTAEAGQFSKAMQDAIRQLNDAKVQAERMSAELTAQNERDVKRHTDSLSSFATTQERLTAKMAVTLGAIGGIASNYAVQFVERLKRGLEDSILSWAEWGHQVEHASRLLGTTTENASVLLFAFRRFGVDTEAVSRIILQLSRHVATNEKAFVALGVATRDANGHFRSAFDIFNDFRRVMSQSQDGVAKTAVQLELMSRSGGQLGGSMRELNAILSLSDEQWKAVEEEARRSNAVLSEAEARTGTQLVMALRQLDQALAGLGRTFGQVAAGPLKAFVDAVNDAIISIQILGSMEGSIGDKIGAFFGVGPLAGQMRKQVDAIMEAQRKLAEMEQGTGTAPENTSAGALNAIHDRIDAIRQEAQARQELLRDTLEAYDRERNAVIATIEAERTASERQHSEAIRALEEEARAAQEAFDARQRARQEQIDGLRLQITLLDQQRTLERDLEEIAKADKALRDEGAITITIKRGETLEDYQRRYNDHQRRLTELTEHAEDARTRYADNKRKQELEAQVRAIELVAAADRRATEIAKKNTDERIREIREQMQLERQQSDDKLKQLRDEMTAERQRVDDAIKQIQRHTDAIVKELEKQLKSLERGGAAFGAFGDAAAGALARITAEAKRAGMSVEALTNALKDLGGGAGTTPRERGRTGTGGVTYTNPPDEGASTEDLLSALASIWARIPLNLLGAWLTSQHIIHDSPHSMMLPEPTLLIGASGRSYGIAAARGPEPIAFGGVGARAGGMDRGGSVTVNVIGLSDQAAVIRIAREVQRRIAGEFGDGSFAVRR